MNWPENSIVFACGPGVEWWGPDTLDQGMGGSEESVVNLPRQFAKLGYPVTVFNERENSYTDLFSGGIGDGLWPIYRPWQELSVDDEFDILILWRNPNFPRDLKGRVKLCDLHDILDPRLTQENAQFVDRYMFKSHFHRNIFLTTADEKCVVVGNGIDQQHFGRSRQSGPKRNHSVGYFSAYTRGLSCLLELWPEIRAEVPDATLDIYYGWKSLWKEAQGDTAKEEKFRLFQRSILARLDLLQPHGVVDHGRVSHEALAKAMMDIEVWAYPTEWHETFCITALKAQEAGCIPVTTNVAALDETVIGGTKISCSQIYSDKDAQTEFVQAVVRSLREPYEVEKVPNCNWSDVAEKWVATFDEIRASKI